MKKYSISINRIIEADNEREATNKFWQSISDAKFIDVEIFEYKELEPWDELTK